MQLNSDTINGETYLCGSVTAQKQNNTININAGQKYVPSNIQINIQVTKAILNNQTGSNTFDIQVPNGNSSPIVFRFSVDENNNTTVNTVS